VTLYLDVDRVIELHDLAAEAVPVIDRSTLESAVARCQAGFGGEDAFPRLVDKAAALLHGIASTQCFQDGNKRTAWLATVVFLQLNGVNLPDIHPIEAEAFVMAVAVSAWSDRTVEKAAEWLEHQSAAAGLPRPGR
jgi:death-on-curing protein